MALYRNWEIAWGIVSTNGYDLMSITAFELTDLEVLRVRRGLLVEQ